MTGVGIRSWVVAQPVRTKARTNATPAAGRVPHAGIRPRFAWCFPMTLAIDRGLCASTATQPGERSAPQECGVAAEDQPNEILEHRFLDGTAFEFQRHAVQSIDIRERYGHQSLLMIDDKRDARRNDGRHRKDA